MQEIYDNPQNVRGLGNVCRLFVASDFHKSNSDIVSGSETVPDIGVVNVFTMSYFDGNINLIVTERGDFFVGGIAYLDVLVVNSDSLPVDGVSVDLTIGEVTVSETTDGDGKCSFLLDTSGMDTFEYGFLATYERATATFNGEYTIKENPSARVLVCTFNDNATIPGGIVGSDMMIQFNDGEWQQYNGGKFTASVDDVVKISGVTNLVGVSGSIPGQFDGCFEHCTGLTSVTLPSTLTEIGRYCFANCSNLTSLVIPDSVTSLSQYCFSQSGLDTVTFTSSTPPSMSYPSMFGVSTAIVPVGSKTTYENAFRNEGIDYVTVIEESEI